MTAPQDIAPQEDSAAVSGSDHRLVRPSLSGHQSAAMKSEVWLTPPEILQALGPFDLDPSAGPMNHAARNIRHPEECGLSAEWSGRVWLNPPYSNVHDWLTKFMEHGDGITLVNARPETQWFQRLVANAAAVHWLKGRIQFDMPEGPSKHPTVGSVLVAYGERNAAALLSSGLPGIVMRVESNISNSIALAPAGGKTPTTKKDV